MNGYYRNEYLEKTTPGVYKQRPREFTEVNGFHDERSTDDAGWYTRREVRKQNEYGFKNQQKPEDEEDRKIDGKKKFYEVLT